MNPDQGEPGGFGGFGGGRFGRGGPGGGRRGPGFEPPRPGDLLPGFVRGMLDLSEEQSKSVDDLQKVTVAKLQALLSDEQQKQLQEPQGPGFQGGPPEPGRILSGSVQARLKLSDDQKEKLALAQKEVDDKLAKVLNSEQKQRLEQFASFGRGFGGPPRGPGGGGPGGRGRGAPGGDRGGPPGGFGFGPGGPGGFGPGGALFRAYRYPKDYAGLSGRTLTPGEKLTELTKRSQPESPKPERPQ